MYNHFNVVYGSLGFMFKLYKHLSASYVASISRFIVYTQVLNMVFQLLGRSLYKHVNAYYSVFFFFCLVHKQY